MCHLRAEGAHSLSELERNPPEVLGLALSRRELLAVLESCRRHGLVARLGPGAGALAAQDEWIATEEGRRAARPAVSWFLSHVGQILVATFGGVASLFAFLHLDGEAGFSTAILLAVGIASVSWAVIRFRRVSSGDRGGKVVAEDWQRWGRERWSLRAVALKRFPWKWLLLYLVAITIGVALSSTGLGGGALWIATIVGTAFLIPVFSWADRWNDVKSLGAKIGRDGLVAKIERQMTSAAVRPPAGAVD
ncbi:MAG TPA: hypothetical protein VG816_13395 [Solirubrobacterales bacterium]|nr:hypothetical protein [Solirubrobacterales bacterium]